MGEMKNLLKQVNASMQKYSKESPNQIGSFYKSF